MEYGDRLPPVSTFITSKAKCQIVFRAKGQASIILTKRALAAQVVSIDTQVGEIFLQNVLGYSFHTLRIVQGEIDAIAHACIRWPR